MRTDRVNQFLVTICVLVVLVTQFNRNETVVEHYDMTPRFSEDLEADNPALTEPKYGVFQRLFQRRKAPQNCFVNQRQPQPSTQPCPDGNCPIQPSSNALQLPQSRPQPNCPDGTCPLVPAQSNNVSSLDKVKTGMVRCSCCGRVIVGNDLHTEWTDAGEPISPCCDECWQKMTNDQRKQSIERWARSAGITDEAVLTRFKGVVQ
jgi:hypothetical protein